MSAPGVSSRSKPQQQSSSVSSDVNASSNSPSTNWQPASVQPVVPAVSVSASPQGSERVTVSDNGAVSVMQPPQGSERVTVSDNGAVSVMQPPQVSTGGSQQQSSLTAGRPPTINGKPSLSFGAIV